MSEAIQTRGQFIRLSHEGGKVVVEPEDEDRFVITAQAAVKACQASQRYAESIHVFKNEFLVPLLDWCRTNSDRVQFCYIPAPGRNSGCIEVFIVSTSETYDFELGEMLAGLELTFLDRGWRNVSILQLPSASQEQLETYFSPAGAIEVYAEHQATQGNERPQQTIPGGN